jgi:arylsulfatase A-like enzyme
MRTRRQMLETLAACAAAPVFGADARRPNVVLIMSDDQGYGDFSCHGNPYVKTPNLDRLAAEGVEMSRFYVSPVCAPTRASLLTGRYHLRSGVHGVTTGRETMRTSEITLAEALKSAGYRTALVGKWHLGEHYPYVPHAQGFDEFTGFRTGHWTEYWDSPLERNGKPFTSKGYIADVFTDEGIRFMESNAKRPFFLYLAYNTPHAPYLAPEKHWEHYRKMDLPPQVAAVYSMVANLDENIGRVLGALDRLQLSNDTVVIFLTDNGPNGQRYTAGLRGAKGSVYEGGVHTAFFLRYGKHYAPRKVEALAGHVDVLPTLLDICGVKRKDGPPLDGRSFKPMLEGKATSWNDDRQFFTWRGVRSENSLYPGAVRTQRYNLINGKELYDIKSDPGERANIAAQHPEKVAELRQAYEAWFRKAGDECGFQRPVIPVGYEQENPARLPGPQAYLNGSLKYAHGTGFAHEWITNWKAIGDWAHWEIDVVKAGRYEISLRYLCPAKDVGSKIKVTVGGKSLEASITAGTSMEPFAHRDLIPRPEVPQMSFATLLLGSVALAAGRTQLRVQALHKAGESVMELDEVILRRT